MSPHTTHELTLYDKDPYNPFLEPFEMGQCLTFICIPLL